MQAVRLIAFRLAGRWLFGSGVFKAEILAQAPDA